MRARQVALHMVEGAALFACVYTVWPMVLAAVCYGMVYAVCRDAMGRGWSH